MDTKQTLKSSNGDSTLRFGIVGCGSIGPTHCAAIGRIARTQILAVADLIPERAKAMAEKFKIGRIYSSDRELIADPDIDVVCLCTPSGMHAEQTVAAMHAGKHVVVEKPMDVTLDAADRMIAAEDATGKKLAIISQHRFDEATQIVKKAIDSGQLGRIILADAAVKWWRKQSYYDSGDWRGTWALDGGGALMNQGVHTVDVLQWLVGGVESVFAHTRTGAHERIEVEDIAVAALSFNCGAVGTFTATTAAYDGLPVRIDIFGTEGSAIIEGDRLKRLVLKNGQTYESQAAAAHAISVARGGTASVKDEAAARAAAAAHGATWGDSHRAQIEDFIRAIQTNTKPLIDGRAARKPLEIILSIYESARAQERVTISAALKPELAVTAPRPRATAAVAAR